MIATAPVFDVLALAGQSATVVLLFIMLIMFWRVDRRILVLESTVTNLLERVYGERRGDHGRHLRHAAE